MLVKTLGANFAAGQNAKKCSCCALLISLLCVLLLSLNPLPVTSHVTSAGSSTALSSDPNLVLVNKCCEKFEIHVDHECQQVNETGKFNSWPGGKLLVARKSCHNNHNEVGWPFNFMDFPFWHATYVCPTLNGPFVGYQWISGTKPTAKYPQLHSSHSPKKVLKTNRGWPQSWWEIWFMLWGMFLFKL